MIYPMRSMPICDWNRQLEKLQSQNDETMDLLSLVSERKIAAWANKRKAEAMAGMLQGQNIAQIIIAVQAMLRSSGEISRIRQHENAERDEPEKKKSWSGNGNEGNEQCRWPAHPKLRRNPMKKLQRTKTIVLNSLFTTVQLPPGLPPKTKPQHNQRTLFQLLGQPPRLQLHTHLAMWPHLPRGRQRRIYARQRRARARQAASNRSAGCWQTAGAWAEQSSQTNPAPFTFFPNPSMTRGLESELAGPICRLFHCGSLLHGRPFVSLQPSRMGTGLIRPRWPQGASPPPALRRRPRTRAAVAGRASASRRRPGRGGGGGGERGVRVGGGLPGPDAGQDARLRVLRRRLPRQASPAAAAAAAAAVARRKLMYGRMGVAVREEGWALGNGGGGGDEEDFRTRVIFRYCRRTGHGCFAARISRAPAPTRWCD
jgi:hypothetical protein